MVLFLSCPRSWLFQMRTSLTRSTKNLQLYLGKRHVRLMSHLGNEARRPEKFLPFLEMINARRDEARRSILVQVQSAQSHKELYSYCSSLGTVKNMHHYSVGVEPLNFIVVEFADDLDVKSILSKSSHFEDPQVVPVQSNFLWFRAPNKKLAKLAPSKTAALAVENGNQMMKDADIRALLRKSESMSEQMSVLHNVTKLNDIGTKLRFLTAKQIEDAVNGMFPSASAIPFGSSVNGFGKTGCDLDLILKLSTAKKNEEARLVFHCKASTGSERTMSQRNMEAIGDLIQLFLPGCAQVRRILQARVPIIKYYQQLTDVECDLSMSNLSGVYMSDFLYLMGSIDDRVRPLVFTIRKWASEVGLTNSSPGRWISNFSLTLMVLAFLQKPINSPPILPSLNTLVKLAGSQDKFMTDDGINCTFLRDISKYQQPAVNSESLESLLCEFFEFCSQFDFESRALCLNEAVAITKPEHCALYIVNPLERGLNVSKNVSLEELERFKAEARNAAWLLQSQEVKSGDWGLLSIFDNKRKLKNPLSFALSTKHGRLMEVSALFEEDQSPIEYKNDSVKKQIENIKREQQNKLAEFKKLNR